MKQEAFATLDKGHNTVKTMGGHTNPRTEKRRPTAGEPDAQRCSAKAARDGVAGLQVAVESVAGIQGSGI